MVPYQHPQVVQKTEECYVEIPMERVVDKIIEVPVYKDARYVCVRTIECVLSHYRMRSLNDIE